MNVLKPVSGSKRLARVGILLTAALVVLAACAEEEIILPGKRENIRNVLEDTPDPVGGEIANISQPISLPAQTQNTEWTQGTGTPSTRVDHPALGTNLTRVWSANIGAGDSRKQRITASPVVAQGLVFTLDADASVTATSLAGARVWQNDLSPVNDGGGQGTGGGLSYKDGKVFVSIGYGALVALDAASGNELWRQKLDGTGSGTPTAFGDLVYVTAGDDTGWAVTAAEGRIVWQLAASPDINNVLGGPAPAVVDDLAIFGFGSGEVQAVFRQGGLRRWDAAVLGERFGRAVSNVGDLTGSPVVSGQTVYVGNQSGRLVALNLNSGTRIWTAREGVVGPVVPAGDSVFLISDIAEILRIDAATGARVWGAELPGFVKSKPKKRAEIFAHHGPILAGGRIHVASNDGLLRSFDPVDGQLVSTVDIPSGATSAPVVAAGVLYVVSTNGQLHAFR